MTPQLKSILKGYFETGDRPTQQQFEDLIDTIPGELAVVGDGDVGGTIALDADVAAAIAAHNSATDPHGDRANTTSQIGTHNTDMGAHANIRSGVVQPLSAPSAYEWTWINQGGSARYDYGDHITLAIVATGGASTYMMRGLETPLTDDGSFVVTACLKHMSAVTATCPWGLYVRNDTIVYLLGAIGVSGIKVESRTALNGVAPTSIYNGSGTIPMPIWLRIERVDADLLCYISLDGQSWALIRTISAAEVGMLACGFYSENRITAGYSTIECDSFSIVE